MTVRARSAFTLVEILIVVVILGILAAIVIPQFTNASQDAQRGNIRTQAQSIRNQIELYRVKNNGVAPGGTAGDIFSLTSGNSLCNPPAGQNTYLRTPPINPRNGLSTVTASTATGTAFATAAFVDPAGTTGWLYNQATGEFAPFGFNETTNKWFGEP